MMLAWSCGPQTLGSSDPTSCVHSSPREPGPPWPSSWPPSQRPGAQGRGADSPPGRAALTISVNCVVEKSQDCSHHLEVPDQRRDLCWGKECLEHSFMKSEITAECRLSPAWPSDGPQSSSRLSMPSPTAVTVQKEQPRDSFGGHIWGEGQVCAFGSHPRRVFSFAPRAGSWTENGQPPCPGFLAVPPSTERGGRPKHPMGWTLKAMGISAQLQPHPGEGCRPGLSCQLSDPGLPANRAPDMWSVSGVFCAPAHIALPRPSCGMDPGVLE